MCAVLLVCLIACFAFNQGNNCPPLLTSPTGAPQNRKRPAGKPCESASGVNLDTVGVRMLECEPNPDLTKRL